MYVSVSFPEDPGCGGRAGDDQLSRRGAALAPDAGWGRSGPAAGSARWARCPADCRREVPSPGARDVDGPVARIRREGAPPPARARRGRLGGGAAAEELRGRRRLFCAGGGCAAPLAAMALGLVLKRRAPSGDGGDCAVAPAAPTRGLLREWWAAFGGDGGCSAPPAARARGPLCRRLSGGLHTSDLAEGRGLGIATGCRRQSPAASGAAAGPVGARALAAVPAKRACAAVTRPFGRRSAGWRPGAEVTEKKRKLKRMIYTGRDICQIKYKFKHPPPSKHEQGKQGRRADGRLPLRSAWPFRPLDGGRGTWGGGRPTSQSLRADSGNRPLRLAWPWRPVGAGAGGAAGARDHRRNWRGGCRPASPCPALPSFGGGGRGVARRSPPENEPVQWADGCRPTVPPDPPLRGGGGRGVVGWRPHQRKGDGGPTRPALAPRRGGGRGVGTPRQKQNQRAAAAPRLARPCHPVGVGVGGVGCGGWTSVYNPASRFVPKKK